MVDLMVQVRTADFISAPAELFSCAAPRQHFCLKVSNLRVVVGTHHPGWRWLESAVHKPLPSPGPFLEEAGEFVLGNRVWDLSGGHPAPSGQAFLSDGITGS